VSDAAYPAGQRAAAEYLRELLLKPGAYRDAWRLLVPAPAQRDGVINQMAVAEILAGHLQAGTLPGHRQLRDVVADSITGRQLPREFLQLFIDAFGFTDDEASRLWRLWNGTRTIRVITGAKAVPTADGQSLSQALGKPRHSTVALHDHIQVGADGRIDQARVNQVVEAIVDGMDRVPFVGDTNAFTLEAGEGLEGVGEVRRVSENVFAAEFLLPKTLSLGDTATLQYRVTYRFPGNFDDPDELSWRRGANRRLENLDMRVAFHPDRLPSRVWWATWDGIDGPLIRQEEVQLDNQHSAHRFLRSAEKTVVGFHWTWPGTSAGPDGDHGRSQGGRQ